MTKKASIGNIIMLVVLVLVGVIVLAVALIPKPAATDTSSTNATGVVTKDNRPVAGAAVSVECTGISKHDITDARGSYLIGFMANECPVGSKVKIIASSEGRYIETSNTVDKLTTRLNIVKGDISL